MSSQVAKEEGKLREQPAQQSLIIVESQTLFDRVKEITETVANRAYEFFESRGRQFGRELDDWLHAEQELLRPVPVEITETERELRIRAEVPGFTARDLEVSIEPQQVIISGKIERRSEPKGEKTLYTELSANEIMRVLDLPAAVDPTNATATLREGVLELVVARPAAIEPVKVQVKDE